MPFRRRQANQAAPRPMVMSIEAISRLSSGFHAASSAQGHAHAACFGAKNTSTPTTVAATPSTAKKMPGTSCRQPFAGCSRTCCTTNPAAIAIAIDTMTTNSHATGRPQSITSRSQITAPTSGTP